jgi:hypothetical protein
LSYGAAKYTVTLGFDGTVEDKPMVTTSKQTVTMDMKNRTLQGGDSYPSCLVGIKERPVEKSSVQKKKKKKK